MVMLSKNIYPKYKKMSWRHYKSGQTHLTFQEAIGTNKKVKILIFSIYIAPLLRVAESHIFYFYR